MEYYHCIGNHQYHYVLAHWCSSQRTSTRNKREAKWPQPASTTRPSLTGRSSGRQQGPWLRHFHGPCWCPTHLRCSGAAYLGVRRRKNLLPRCPHERTKFVKPASPRGMGSTARIAISVRLDAASQCLYTLLRVHQVHEMDCVSDLCMVRVHRTSRTANDSGSDVRGSGHCFQSVHRCRSAQGFLGWAGCFYFSLGMCNSLVFTK